MIKYIYVYSWFRATERKRKCFFNFSLPSYRTQELSVSRRLILIENRVGWVMKYCCLVVFFICWLKEVSLIKSWIKFIFLFFSVSHIVTTNWMSSLCHSRQWCLFGYFTYPECNNFVHNTRIYTREKEREREMNIY